MKKVAIVGVGPRGLSALENLYYEVSKLKTPLKVHTTLFEIADQLGAGSVWNVDQPKTNWMNISERALQDLKGRPFIKSSLFEIPMFPCYKNWNTNQTIDDPSTAIDTFPPRSKMGQYLNERFNSIFNALYQYQLIEVVKERVDDITSSQNYFRVITAKNLNVKVDEVLLAIGHQDTETSKQLMNWSQRLDMSKNKILFKDPYPISNYTIKNKLNKSSQVAIRGFGLAMIDVSRALTIGYGRAFKITNSKTLECRYIPNEHSIQTIIPFSLDGLPPVPKPISAKIDKLFAPSEHSLQTFQTILSNHALGNIRVNSIDFFINAINEVICEVFLRLESRAYQHEISKKELTTLVKNFVLNQNYDHPLFLNHSTGCVNIMKAHLNMALGKDKFSLDYCIGQVWRHCQPTLYKELSHADISNEIIKKIIDLDEKLKRYTYGPPVESMQQLIALNTSGVLNFDFLNNPTIEINDSSWKFSMDKNHKTIDVMINSVLDPPKILKVSSHLIQKLLHHSVLTPAHSDLGVETNIDGTFLYAKKDGDVKALAMVGRLCKGSVIGVDAILECFGPRIEDWAKGVVLRLSN